MWVPLIEKAYAKLHQSYEAIEGGWVDSALVDLTGGVPERYSWDSPNIKQRLHDGTLWKELLAYYESGFLLGSGSPVGSSDSERDASSFGIVQSHAYSVLKLVEVEGHCLIQVRNPWGRFEWKGDWGDKSPLWTSKIKTKVGFVDAEDGTFFMSWTDFCIHFNEVYVCRFFDSRRWPSQGRMFGEWKEMTAGGCCKYVTVKNNPQYSVWVDSECELVLELIQIDPRGSKGGAAALQLQLIIMELYDNGGRPIEQTNRGKMISNVGCNTQEIHLQTKLKPTPQDKPYTLLCCTFDPNLELHFTVKFYCTTTLRIQAFPSSSSSHSSSTPANSTKTSLRTREDIGMTADELASVATGAVKVMAAHTRKLAASTSGARTSSNSSVTRSTLKRHNGTLNHATSTTRDPNFVADEF